MRVLDGNGLSALQGSFDCTDWSVFVQNCENVDQLNDCVTDYIHFCIDIQTREKEVLCYPNNKLKAEREEREGEQELQREGRERRERGGRERERERKIEREREKERDKEKER